MLKKLMLIMLAGFVLVGCSAEVGSKAWCEQLEEKPKGNWTGNEAADYAKNCVFRSDDE